MAQLPIITAPDPRLKVRSKPVEAVDDDIRRLIDDMFDTMYAADGIGLAAIQVGVPKRIIVTDVREEGEEPGNRPPHPRTFINPEILWHSDAERAYEEGCLSLPEQYAEVVRPAAVRVRYLDRDGEQREEELDGIFATCLQHEIDHLEGTLFVDHISTLKRNMILRRLAKQKKLKQAG